MGKYKVGDFVVVAHDDSLVVVELSIERERERWEEEMPSREQHQDKRGELEEDERERATRPPSPWRPTFLHIFCPMPKVKGATLPRPYVPAHS